MCSGILAALLAVLMSARSADTGPFAAFVMKESWTGLAGTVTAGEGRREVPVLLWGVRAVSDDPEMPGPLVVPPAFQPAQRLQLPVKSGEPVPWKPAGRVQLEVRGLRVEFTPAPRKSVLVESDFDGDRLGYPPEGDRTDVRFYRESCRETEWKIIEGVRTVSRKDHGRDGFQFEARQTVKFRLEAAHRPGWFLVLSDGRLQLSQDADPHFLELQQTVFFDDLRDGR